MYTKPRTTFTRQKRKAKQLLYDNTCVRSMAAEGRTGGRPRAEASNPSVGLVP